MVKALFLHAHPDDESLWTGGLIVKLLAAGIDVHVVTATLGEEGEVIGNKLKLLEANQADQLGGYRITELTRALAILQGELPGKLTHEFLGGVGFWRDSGMEGNISRSHRIPLVYGGLAIQVGQLQKVYLKHFPDLVVTYDSLGGYGHRDHVRCNRIVIDLAKKLQAENKFVSDLYLSKHVSDTAEEVQEMHQKNELAKWVFPEVAEISGFNQGGTCNIYKLNLNRLERELKIAAMQAHQTQITVDTSGNYYIFSNNIVHKIRNFEVYEEVVKNNNSKFSEVFS